MSFFKVFYTKVGGQPFEFVFSSTVMCLQPPDKFWKKAKEPYLVGVIRNKHGDKTGEAWAEKDVWVPDDEKNETGAKPKNWLYISQDIWHYLNNSKYKDEVQWLLPETRMVERMEDEKKRLEKEMEYELESKRKLLSAQYEKEISQHERKLAELQAHHQTVEESVKRSLKAESKVELKAGT